MLTSLYDSGLIVKQALIEARKQVNDPSYHDIYNDTHAIIFFGTPHRGSNIASWGRLLSGIAQATQIDTNDSILIDLDPKSGSSKLEELRLDFDDILRDSQRARKLRVFSFQEEEGMTGVSLFGSKVSLRYSDPRALPQRGPKARRRNTSTDFFTFKRLFPTSLPLWIPVSTGMILSTQITWECADSKMRTMMATKSSKVF